MEENIFQQQSEVVQTSLNNTPNSIWKSKLLLISGGVLLIVLVGFGGFFLGKILSQPKTSPSSISQLSPTPAPPTQIPTPTPTTDPTANWKTYTDENTHIQFKYPPNWYAQKNINSTFTVFLEDKPFQIIKGEFMTSIIIGLNELENTASGQKLYAEKTLEEGVERFKGLFDPKTVQITELTIAGKKAAKLSGLLGPGMLEGEYFVSTLIQLKDKLLVVTLTKKSYEDVYNQILSTFKFLD